MNHQKFKAVAKISDLELGKMLLIKHEQNEILLCQTSNGYYAVDNHCSHAKARLNEGKLKGNKVFCPLHGAAFDVRNGCALSLPASKALKSYSVRVDNDLILVEIDCAELS